MPLQENPSAVKLADELVDTIRATFDTPENYRPVHATGQLVKGTFTPSKDAAKLSEAPIFSQHSIPLIMRYNTDTGLKDLPANGENGSRGFAIRFGFVVSTGEGFLDQFKAMKDNKMEEFLDKYSHARYFMENQSPAHSYSFATEQWDSVRAFKFINAEGKEQFFRWRIVPWQRVIKADAVKQSKNYQFEDLERRIKKKKPIRYRLLARLAEEGDVTNDSTVVWPETNEFVEMGEIVIDRLWTMDEGSSHGREQKKIIYDPVPRYMAGVKVSDDPLLEVRTAVYLMSGMIRREHLDEEVQQAVR